MQKIRNIFYGLLSKYLIKKRVTLRFHDEVYDFIKPIKNKGLLLSYTEAEQLYNIVFGIRHIKGSIAEVGVYKGGSAKIIRRADNKKHIYLFDTFEGLPYEDSGLRKGDYRSEFSMLKSDEITHIIKGIFPESVNSKNINEKFSFVHLDVDLYKSTLDSLKYFYPRMNKGGIIVSHDYLEGTGVKKAFDEFGKPIIKLSDSQCMLIV